MVTDTTRSARARRTRWGLAVAAFALAGLWLAYRGPAEAPSAASGARAEPEPAVARDAIEAVVAPDGATRSAARGAPSTGTTATARAEVTAPPDPATPEEGLVIRAVGADGKTVPHVTVEWVLRARTGGIGGRHLRGSTDARGLLEVERADEFLSAYFGPGPASAFTSAVGLRCAMPFEELAPTEEDDAPYTTWLDGRPEPGSVVDVRVPPYGFVHFTWEAPPSPHGGLLHPTTLMVRRSDNGHFPGWRDGVRLDDGASEFTFGPIGLGWEVWGGLARTGLLDDLGGATGAGPQLAGETVTIPLVVRPEDHGLVALRGRVVPFTPPKNGGRPRAYLEFHDRERERARRKSVALGEEGRFELLMRRAKVPGAITIQVGHKGDALTASRALPALAPDCSVLDMGEVRLQAPPRTQETPDVALVSGRVVDVDGAPLAGAQVYVYGRASRIGEREVRGSPYGHLTSARTDASGLFDISAAVVLASDDIFVDARCDGYVRPRGVAAKVGSTGVELILERGADVRMTLRVHDYLLMSESISFDLARCRNSAERRGMKQGSDGEPSEWPWVFRGVPPGEHTFAVKLHGSDWPPLEFPVEVRGAAKTIDLGLIDLTDEYRLASLRLVDGEGNLVTDGRLRVTGTGARGARSYGFRSGYITDDGSSVLVLPAEVQGVVVEHPEAGRAVVPADALGPIPTGATAGERTTITLRR